MSTTYTPETVDVDVTTVTETKPQISNYPEVGSRIVARLGESKIVGTVEEQDTHYFRNHVIVLLTGVTKPASAPTYWSGKREYLNTEDGWTFEITEPLTMADSEIELKELVSA